jgi:hypothetical protein
MIDWNSAPKIAGEIALQSSAAVEQRLAHRRVEGRQR